MEQVKTLGIVGRIAAGTKLCDGQTIKTRVLRDELRVKYPEAEINIVDVYNYKKRLFTIIWELIDCLKNSQIVIVLLSRNGRRFIFPLISFFNLFFHKPLIHDVIGGGSVELIQKYPRLKKYYLKFEDNWVESVGLKNALGEIGIHNVTYIPNFKRLNAIQESELKPYAEEVFRFCTFSRVNEEKGIGRAVEAISAINAKAGRYVAVLDIYGPIEDGYEKQLENFIALSNGCVDYKGVADSNQSVEILKNYYCLLFPTTFYGEGFPGTLIDAMSAGIPVIATDWHMNGDIIKHGTTGFVYPCEHHEKLEELIAYSMEHRQKINAMKSDCIRESKKYSPDEVVRIIDEKIRLFIRG